MKNHFRKDLTSWHVLEYDSISGKVLNKHTKLAYSDDSRWSRRQAWRIYGYTMVYRDAKDKKFLKFAKNISDKYLSSEAYSGVGKADSFLLNSTGAKSLGHEIDVALIYADYYIKTLSGLKSIDKNK